MTTLSPPPVDEFHGYEPPTEPVPRPRRRLSRGRKAVIAGGLAVLLVAGLAVGSYQAPPGGTLWGIGKAVFPGHAQDVALTAVVTHLKRAQDILGSGQQPTPTQLTDARTALNDAKRSLDYVSPSPERTSMQNLYLQLTQQLLQYTPATVQQLPDLPAPPAESPDGAALSETAPTWGYIDQQSADYLPPPAGVPYDPAPDWPQPVDPPLTANMQYLGYYDPSWGTLYGYNSYDWYNYGLGGYNQYGYDFLGYDRWGYDRWGYDRWGYDRWGYNWSGYNWAGYDRHGWDRDGRNEWGQRRDFPGDPRDHDWYHRHHLYRQHYEWKFHNSDPVYRRAQWDRAHGFNPHRYQDWNKHRDWHNPRKRDWTPRPHVADIARRHLAPPVVNLNTSLAEFISNDRATAVARPLMKDLAAKSPRDFATDLTARHGPVGRPELLTPGKRLIVGDLTTRPGEDGPRALPSSHPDRSAGLRGERDRPSLKPPALTAPAPKAPPSKVSPDFVVPKLAPAPEFKPPKVSEPQGRPGPADGAPRADPDHSARPDAIPPRADLARPDVTAPGDHNARPDHPVEVPREPHPNGPVQDRDRPDSPEVPDRQAPQQRNEPEHRAPEAPDRPSAPEWQGPQQRAEPKHSAPEPPVQPAPEPQAPAWQPPARQEVPKQEAPRQAPQAPAWQPPARQEAPKQEPPRQAPQAPAWQPPARQEAPRQAPQAPAWQPPARQEAPRHGGGGSGHGGDGSGHGGGGSGHGGAPPWLPR